MTLISPFRLALVAGVAGAIGFAGLSPSTAAAPVWTPSASSLAAAAASGAIGGFTVDDEGTLVDNVTVEAYAADSGATTPVASALTYGGEFFLRVPTGSYVIRFSDLDARFRSIDYNGGAAVTVTKGALDLGEVTMVRVGELLNTALPTVKGKAMAGETVRAVPGSWTPDATSFGYQWYVGETPVEGATTKQFTVPQGRAGEALTVLVTASDDTDAVGVARSSAVDVRRVATETTAKLDDAKIKPSDRGEVTVRVSPADLVDLAGKKVKLLGAGSKLSAELNKAGKATIRLPKLSVGTYKLSASFEQTAQAGESTSDKVTLTVKK